MHLMHKLENVCLFAARCRRKVEERCLIALRVWVRADGKYYVDGTLHAVKEVKKWREE